MAARARLQGPLLPNHHPAFATTPSRISYHQVYSTFNTARQRTVFTPHIKPVHGLNLKVEAGIADTSTNRVNVG